jgi:hypothetical protein
MIEYNPKDVRVVIERGRYYVESKLFLWFWSRHGTGIGWDTEQEAVDAAIRVYQGIQARRTARADRKPRVVWDR